MKKVILSPATPQGEMRVPPSKSAAHRAILCAALSRGRSVVDSIDLSADILATLRAVALLGASVRPHPGGVIVDGSRIFQPQNVEIHCGESGSTLRFLVPIAAAGGVACTFTGSGNGRLTLCSRCCANMASPVKQMAYTAFPWPSAVSFKAASFNSRAISVPNTSPGY